MGEPTFSIQWHITDTCDQRCKHCYIFGDRSKTVTLAETAYEKCVLIIDDLVATCEMLGARPRVTLTGGDPLLHARFWDILAYLGQKKVMTAILGNPFRIDPEIAARLRGAGVTRYQLSLDGLEAKHDDWRKPGSFKATERAIAILKNADIKVGVMSTVSRDNAEDVLRLAAYVVSKSVDSYAFARYCPSADSAGSMFTALEYREFLVRAFEIYKKFEGGPTKFVLKDHLWLLLLSEMGLFKPEPTNGVIVSGCGLGISHLTVLPDGKVYACRRFESPVGIVPDQSLAVIFQGQALTCYRDVKRMEKCADCELACYCRGCMAVAHCATGRWTAPDPQCWK